MNILDKFSSANKAWLAGGLLAIPGFNIILQAVIAYYLGGEAIMPSAAELQEAIVTFITAILGGILIYMVPNWGTEPVAETVLVDVKPVEVDLDAEGVVETYKE